jgi:hypothetical protein
MYIFSSKYIGQEKGNSLLANIKSPKAGAISKTAIYVSE